MKKINWANGSMLAIITMLLSLNVNADIKTYNWQQDLKDFVIQEIPGTSPIEYVAVGTIHYQTTIGGYQVNEGIHFMHFEHDGTLKCDRTFYVPETVDGYFTLQVVDLAIENNNSFWVTLLARTANGIPPFDRDMVYLTNIDANCNFITPGGAPLNGFLPDHNLETQYHNFIPTHSEFHNGHLFISGYMVNKYLSYPIPAHTFHGDKIGAIVKIDVNSPILNVAAYFAWDTPLGNSFNYDNDVPTKIKISDHNTILLVGSANSTTNHESRILLMEFDDNLNLLAANTIQPTVPMQYNGWVLGTFGQDIIHDNVNGGYYVLANHTDGGHYYKWSVTHVDNSLQADPSVPAMAALSRPQTPQGTGWTDVRANTLFDDGTIFGLQTAVICPPGIIPAPHQTPSSLSVSPFLNFATYSYSNTTGISRTPASHKVQLSINGTPGNYLFPGAGIYMFGRFFDAALEDKGATPGYKIMAAVGDASGTYVNAKFITTDVNGDETQCNSTIEDCDLTYTTDYVFNESPFSQHIIQWATYVFAYPTDDNLLTTENDCGAGNYKSGKQPKNKNKVDYYSKPGPSFGVYPGNSAINDFKIFPNPATSQTNVTINLTNGSNINIQVVDAMGRMMQNIDRQYEKGQYKIPINTTQLSTGMYTVRVQTNTEVLTKKLIIAK